MVVFTNPTRFDTLSTKWMLRDSAGIQVETLLNIPSKKCGYSNATLQFNADRLAKFVAYLSKNNDIDL